MQEFCNGNNLALQLQSGHVHSTAQHIMLVEPKLKVRVTAKSLKDILMSLQVYILVNESALHKSWCVGILQDNVGVAVCQLNLTRGFVVQQDRDHEKRSKCCT